MPLVLDGNGGYSLWGSCSLADWRQLWQGESSRSLSKRDAPTLAQNRNECKWKKKRSVTGCQRHSRSCFAERAKWATNLAARRAGNLSAGWCPPSETTLGSSKAARSPEKRKRSQQTKLHNILDNSNNYIHTYFFLLFHFLIISAPLLALWSVQTSLLFLNRRHCRGPRETCCRPEGQLLLEGTWGAKGRSALIKPWQFTLFKNRFHRARTHANIHKYTHIIRDNNASVITHTNVSCETKLLVLNLFLPHDGECGHVQGDPGAWLELCLVQL